MFSKASAKRFACDKCDKSFHKESKLKCHTMEVHLRQFTCEFCEKTYTNKGSWRKHILHSHTRSNIARQCDLCDKIFARRDSLTRHKKHIHSNGGKAYKCDDCSFECHNKAKLKVHSSSVHLKLKHPCDHCDKAFSRRQNLRRHVKFYHEKNDTFKCDVCSQRFSERAYLKMHISSVHLKIQHPCDLCDKKFSALQHLVRHRKNKHKHKTKTLDTGVLKCPPPGTPPGTPPSTPNNLRGMQSNRVLSCLSHLSCDFCDMTFNEEMQKAMHIVEDHADQVFNSDEKTEDTQAESKETTQITGNAPDPDTELQCEKSKTNNCDSLPLESPKLKDCHTTDSVTNVTNLKDVDVVKPYQCGICFVAFVLLADLTSHVDMLHLNPKNEEKKGNDCIDSVTSVTEKSLSEEDPKLTLFPVVVLPRLDIVTVNIGKKSVDNKAKKPTFECEKCDLTFPTNAKLKLHMGRLHGIRPFKCDFCGIKFALESRLKKHQSKFHSERNGASKIAKRPLICERCDKTFSNVIGLRLHIRTVHLGEKRYKCDFCDKSFTQSHNLKHHIYVNHKGLSPMMKPTSSATCDRCDKCFSSNAALRLHISTVHLGEKRFKCDFCEKSFKHAHNWKSHVNAIHKGIKVPKIPCKFCNKLLRAGSMKRHVSTVHNRMRKHKCDKCYQTFTQRSSMKTHMKTKHGISKTFQCDVCDARFSRKEFLKCHKQRLHLKKQNQDGVTSNIVRVKQEI